MILPRYPIYIPSKGRSKTPLTAQMLARDGVPFRLVVEPQERDIYSSLFGKDYVLVLPFHDQGSVIPARNWIKDHAIAEGYERHWQLDDNISTIYRVYRAKRIRCPAGIAFRMTEDFVDRYENVAIAGLNYSMFIYPQDGAKGTGPFHLNCRIYSCSLVLNSIPHRWRGRYNEDADICLQVLADGWCTVLLNAFLIQKKRTMTMRGGNTAELYEGDGRLRMARSLERVWPGVVKTSRRYGRPQHRIYDNWRRFDTPLKLKSGIKLEDFEPVDNRGLRLVQVAPKVKSERLRKLLREQDDG